MAARVCDGCGIKYPHLIFECRACSNVLRYVAHTPADYAWEAKAAAKILELEEGRRAVDLSRTVPRLNVGTIRDETGRRWLYARDLISSGWLSPVATFQLFETLEGIVEVQGLDGPRRRYWVEVIG